jgi:NAD(P)-dependent dehydrogenase (short-subunit alcohol dehydrogenase family)
MSDTRNVLVTGASSGFGTLIARTLLEKGYTVFATMRDVEGRNARVAQELAESASGKPGTLHVLDLDVTSDESVGAAVGRAIEIGGGIDVLVNNAGIGAGGIAEGFTPEQWRQIFDVNVFGVQRVNRAVLPTMRERGHGLVVNVSSIMGRINIPFSAPYTATKWALEGMTETYRYELSGTGVDVALVEPGGFMTGFAERMLAPADADRVAAYGPIAEIPEQMWGGFIEQLQTGDAPDPQEVADAVLTLIETPAGQRPLRTVVDPFMGGDAPKSLNATSDDIQRGLLTGFGLGNLLSVKK